MSTRLLISFLITRKCLNNHPLSKIAYITLLSSMTKSQPPTVYRFASLFTLIQSFMQIQIWKEFFLKVPSWMTGKGQFVSNFWEPQDGYQNGYTLNPLVRVYWRSILVPELMAIATPVIYLLQLKSLQLGFTS